MLGRFVKINQPYFYYAVYVFCASIFAAEAVANIFVAKPGNLGSIQMWHIVLIGLAIAALFLVTNTFCSGLNRNFSKVTSPIKFIPLFVVILLGIIFGLIYGKHNLFIQQSSYNGDPSGSLTINGIFMSMPAILFALDSFLVVGNIAGDVKNPKRNVPLSIILSMVLSGTVYILITIGQICTGCGNAYDVIRYVFGQGNNPGTISAGGHACLIIISIFILIAIFGVINSLAMGCVSGSNAAVEENVVIGSKTLKR
jgi:amino acid transporter